MGFGKIGVSTSGDASAPSGSIWGDCPNRLLEDLGLGYFAHEDFVGTSTGILAATLDINQWSANGLKIDADTDTVLTQKAGEQGGYLDIETDGDDNDAAAIFTQPIGKIVRNSGNKLWFEVRLELGVIGDQGVFVGLTEEAGLSRDVLADDIASNGVITESLIGFLCDNGDTNAFDIVLRKDAGAVVNVLNDATASASLTAAGGTAASLLADTEVKLGIYFNGRDTISFMVNGYKVASYDVDATVDQGKLYGGIVAIKTGTAAAQSIAVDFTRAAAQLRS